MRFEPILSPVNLSDNSAAGNSAEISLVFSKTRSITIFSLKSKSLSRINSATGDCWRLITVEVVFLDITDKESSPILTRGSHAIRRSADPGGILFDLKYSSLRSILI